MDLITLPTATSVIADMKDFSATFFTELLPYALAIVGLLIGATLLSVLAGKVYSAVKIAVNRRKGRGRRGRR